MTDTAKHDGPSLEQLLESGMLPAEILHPGGLEITRELAELCDIGPETKLLDVASGTGEAACFLAETFQCNVVGLDASEYMIERAREKAQSRNLDIDFRQGDAHALPFDEHAFDAVISECTTCVLDKARAIREMARVTKPGGHVGIHDLCWKEDSPDELKQQLEELENEHPETLDGWKQLFEAAGLTNVVTTDKADLIASWTNDVKQQLGFTGQLKIYWNIIRQWGFGGLRHVMKSEQVFQNEHLGYGVIVGTKWGSESACGPVSNGEAHRSMELVPCAGHFGDGPLSGLSLQNPDSSRPAALTRPATRVLLQVPTGIRRAFACESRGTRRAASASADRSATRTESPQSRSPPAAERRA